MTSRERLLTVLRGGRPDRVPVTLYEHSPFNDDWVNREPTYALLIAMERRYGDSFVFAPVDDCPIFLGDPNVVRGTEERHADGTLVMTTQIVVAHADDSTELCLRKMKQAGCRHLPVVEGKELIGMLSLRDLLLIDISEKDDKIEFLHSYMFHVRPTAS